MASETDTKSGAGSASADEKGASTRDSSSGSSGSSPKRSSGGSKPRSRSKSSSSKSAGGSKSSSSSSSSKSGSSSSAAKPSESDVGPRTPAAVELDQRNNRAGQGDDLEKRAKQEEADLDKSLKAGEASTPGEKAAAKDLRERVESGNVAAVRDGANAGPNRGRVDNMTRRSDADVDEGHFCLIDYSVEGAKEAVLHQLAPEGSALAGQGFEPGVGSADYGVYLHPGQMGEDGYPATGIVLLRDEHAAQVVVPYEALKPAPAGRH